MLISDAINELQNLHKLEKFDIFCNRIFLQYLMNCLISSTVSTYTAERLTSAIKIICMKCDEQNLLSIKLY